MSLRDPKCCSCGAMMHYAGPIDFRIGAGGKVKLLRDSATSDPSLLPLDVLVCPACGRVELFAGEAVKDALLSLVDKRRFQPPSSRA